ncbi:recombination regulator RecX [Clostridium chauvoei]|uniref:Regulatory protein RecX n=2 Tax=Clostridium chauvoei TaxID=46867 RepID=A0A1U6JGQ0_9CLOT|nr:recombination regulator RecX [Clostridium chauvoei]ATD55304.1 recombination regulator RecX [Clostridium chauvoei]ATD57022.1 recombination regulator RecX [Clostridium chauvoei]MBX7280813.1 recombination regulator RecX [Clostridium chauvoei]MBX7283296.1 recombination regulator RecX [Clostridium chauvoei]MBX7285770.1 recombination regulator RecX [Clostridium chauvoei]
MNVITKIEVQKKNKDRVNIYINEDYAFSLSAELVYKEGLKVKQSIDIDKIKKVALEDDYMKCKNSALRIVEKNYKTKKEIIDKLTLKGYDENTINRTIEFLKEYNFINDENYARMYVNDKIKNHGANKIKYDLIRKGISEDLIKNQISNIDENAEREVAYSLALKKYNLLIKREQDNYKLSQKLYRFLLSKGYSYDVTSEIVKKVTSNEEIY